MKTNFTKIGFNQSVWAIIAVCLLFVSGNVWGTETFTMSSIFDGSNTSASVTSPVNATVSTTATAGNADDGKLSGDDQYFQIILTDNTFTAVSFNGYINTTSTDKNWGFQFTTNGGSTWGSEVTQANDGTKSAHDINVGVSIPSGANGIRIIRKAATTSYVFSVTFTLAASSTYRTFKSGEIIYFKDYSSNMSTLGGSTHWKNGDGNVYAKFYDESAKTWTYCASYADLVSGSWNGDNAIYKIIVPGSSKTYTKVIFTRGTGNTDGNTWNKTVEQTPEIGKNMFIIADSKSGDDWTGSWNKYAKDPALIGDFNDWDPDKGTFVDGKVVLELEASTDYEFKVLVGDGTVNTNYWSCSLCSKATNTVDPWQELYSNQNNWSMTSGEAGEYCFHWNNSTHYLGIYYPQARLTKNTYIYFDVTSETYWNKSAFDAKFYMKYYDSGSDLTGMPLSCTTPLENYVYYAVVPNNDWVGRIQMNRYVNSSEDGVADVCYAYNRTSSLQNCMTHETGKTDYKDSWTPQWKTYCPPMSKPTLSDNSPEVFAGDGSSGSPFIVEKGTSITFTASGSTSSVDDDNMTAKYQFKNGASSLQDGEGTEYTLELSGSRNTSYTITVDAYNYYNSTSSTHTASDAIYYTTETVTKITYKHGSYSTGDDVVDKKAQNIDKTFRGTGLFSRTGYNQTAWNTNANGTSGTSYELNGTYTANTKLDLYPTWTAKTTTLTLNPNTANHGTGSNVSVTATYAAVLPSFDAAVPASGYGLLGYYTDATGGTKIINADGTLVKNTDYSTNESTPKWNSEVASLTLYAQYQLVYTVTYNANGDGEGSATGTTGSVPSDATKYPNGATVTVLGKNTLAKSGNAFAGWNTEADGDGTWRVPTETFSMGSANVTLYAQWVAEDEMEAGTMYYADDMAAKALGDITSTETYRGGISSNGIFEVLGEGTSNATGGPMSAKTVSKATIDGENFTSMLYFKGTGTGNPSGTGTDLPTSRAIKFRVGEAGTLHLYVKGPGNISLIKYGGTAAAIGSGDDNAHVTVDVTAGTYYLFATAGSRSLYGMKLITCTDVDAPTSLTCSAQTPNTLTYTWTKESNASGYTASIYSDSGCESLVSSQNLGDVATVTFTSLTASTTYYCKVQSNGDGSTYCENGGTTSAQSGTTTAPRIIYNANLDGTSGSTTDGTATEGAKACGYSKSGYKFKWWNTATNGSGEDFYVGESVTLGGSDVNLYAQWETVGSDEEFWVGDPKVWHATTHDVTVGDMNIKPQDYSSNDNMINDDFTGGNKDYTIVNATDKRAIVMALGAKDKYIEISFTDGSTINELDLGVAAKDGTNPEMAVLYSTTSDFSSGDYYFAEVEVPTIAQTSKQVTSADPDKSDKYKYVRIYMELYTSVYSQTGGTGNKLRIYSIKAKKGTASYTVTYDDGGATSGSVPEDDTEYAEGAEVTVLGNTGSLTKTEHTFGGWSDGVTTYAAGDKFDMSASNVTLTAVWIINQYNVAVASVGHVTITATPAGGSAISEGNNANVDYGKSVTLAYSSLESGNYWGGWKVTKNSDGSDVTASVVDGNTLTVPAYAVTVSAVTYGDLVVWCDPQVTVSDGFCLTSYYLDATASTTNCVYTTSAAGNLLTINSTDLGGVDKIEFSYLDGNDDAVALTSSPFRLCNDGSVNYNVADPGTTATSWNNTSISGSSTCELSYSIRYKPTDYDLMDNYKLKMVFKKGTEVRKTVIREMNGRSLPEEFVIAVKSGDQWYALPNTLAATQDAQGSITPIKITVDNTTTPTKASYAPTTTVYKGRAKYATANPSSMALTSTGSNYLQTSSSVYKMWLSSSGDADDVDWYFKSSDRSVYTLAMDPVNSPSKKMGIYSGGYMGYHGSPSSSDIYLLPIETKYTDMPAVVTEWGQKSVILDVDAQTAATAEAHIGGADPETAASFGQTRTSVKSGATKYNYTLTFSTLDFSENKGGLLYIDWKNGEGDLVGCSQITIPWIIASDGTMSIIENRKTYWQNEEVHVLPEVTLTADAGTFSGVTIKQLEIYPGATVNVTTGTLNVTNLVLRNGWTRAGEKAYDVARLYITPPDAEAEPAVVGANLTTTNAYADWYIDYDQYYPIAVPFPVATIGISYKNSNSAASAGVKLRYYSGERRATNIQQNQEDNWVEYNWNGTTPAMPDNLEPSKGYIMTAKRPTGKAFSIVRMPMTFSNDWTTGGEKGSYVDGSSVTHTKNQVAVTAWGNENTPSYAKGWNMIANPYMALHEGALSYNDGSGDEIQYANIPDVSFKEYDQLPIDATELKPASAFLIQAPKDGTVTFESTSRVVPAPSYRKEEAPTPSKQKAYIVLGNEEANDMMGLIISDRYTAEYEINADLEKLLGDGTSLKTYMHYGDRSMAYVAINQTLAQEWIPVSVRLPQTGEYTFSLHDASKVGELEGLYLIDYTSNEITNLIEDSYTFVAEAGTISNRFAINATVGERQTPTAIDVIGADKTGDGPVKFLYRDKVYIWHRGVIYDATGKKVGEINK